MFHDNRLFKHVARKLFLLSSIFVVKGYIIPHHRHLLKIGRCCQEFKATTYNNNYDDDDDDFDVPTIELPPNAVTEESSFTLNKKVRLEAKRWWKKATHVNATLVYTYKYDKLLLQPTPTATSNGTSPDTVVGIILIHPIGVGISRWFYERLLKAFSATSYYEKSKSFLIVSPDLLGSGSACDPKIEISDSTKHLPLLNISDWSNQLINLMAETEASQHVDRWCLVANGGCSPIALQVAERRYLERNSSSLRQPVTNVIISSAPRLSFFLTTPSDNPSKVAKAYERLCGVVGRLFWWYACRKEGKFIQRFSEKNLVASPDNLGETWRSNCYQTAKSRSGKSRYSTFAFLAGTLQDGCQASLDAIKKSGKVRIDVIKGRDVRRNQAKSWFWQKSKRTRSSDTTESKPRVTFRDFVEANNMGGREISVGGRVSLAHEDPDGYCDAILSLLQGESN